MRISSILLSPFYALQLASGAKSFGDNPFIGSKWLNKKGLHEKRVAIAMRMAAWRRKKLEKLVTPDDRRQYAENGFVRVENFLSPDVFAAATRELAERDFERHDMLQGATVTRRAIIDDDDLESLPGFKAARNDPRLVNLLRYVSSHAGQPLLVMQIVMALPSALAKKSADPQTMLHSDTFHPTAKAWLFLRDVGEEDGPFAYVPGSHEMTPQRFAWERHISENVDAIDDKLAMRGSLRIPQDELATLGYGQPVKMTVKANTLIVADTHGFHARSLLSDKQTTRIEIYGSLRRNPYLPFTGLHIASLPFIASGMNRLIISAMSLRGKLGLRGSPWVSAGNGKADEWSKRLKQPGA